MAELRYLKDADGNIIYPVTHTDAIIGDINNNEYQTITDTNLSTGNKTVVGAINEIYQNVNNGKQLIASAIGNPLVTNKSTFETMSEAILGLRRDTDNETDAKEVLYNMMIEDGYDEATSSMTVDELIQLLDDSQISINEIKQISCGSEHVFILKNDGSIWSCGFNSSGQLGLGDTTDRNTFTQVTTNINNDVKQIVCGNYHTFILKNDGSVYACGYNDYGQLGLGNTTSTYKTSFTQVTTNINNDVNQVFCGYNHTFILKNNGSVWSCGGNMYGALGLGDTTNRNTFTKVTTNISNVKQIACGEDYTFILKNDGSVWSCGYNEYGALGLGNTTDRNTFTKVTKNINNDVKQMSCAGHYTFILKNDGSVWSCGHNGYGQLGLGNTTSTYKTSFTQVTTNVSNVKEIICYGNRTLIIKNDNSLWFTGTYINEYNWNSAFTLLYQPVADDMGEFKLGSTFIYLLKNDGTVWSYGSNSSGQLGLGDTSNRTAFTQVPLSSQSIDEYEMNRQKLYYYLLDNSIDVTEDMDINTMLDLLVDDYINNMINEYYNNLKLVLIDEGIEVTEEDDMNDLIVKVDEEFTKDNNTISEMEEDAENTRNTLAGLMQEGGYDITGDEDINSLLDLLVLSDISITDIKQIACGENHTFILKNNGSLWSCGYNNYGQLGLGDVTQRTSFTQVTTNINSDVKQVIRGSNHTFIIKNNGSVWSCGRNGNGQLGLGDNTDRNTFTQVTTNINNDVKQIACGAFHTFILKNDGGIYSCGYNSIGQLGLGDTTTRTTFTKVTTNINSDVKQVICGSNHTFILKNDGSLWACGLNSNSQLGLGDNTNKKTFTQVTTNINNDVKQIVCCYYHTVILKNDGSLWGCGLNDYGQLGLGDTDNRTTFTQATTNINNDVKQIACGYYHTFILKNDGSVWSCGYNYYGQLGLGNTTDKNTFTQVTTNINNDVKQVACGQYHTFILKNDGSLWSCGRNNNGQLGMGDTTIYNTFTNVPRGF